MKEKIERVLKDWAKAKWDLEAATTKELRAKFKVGEALTEAKEKLNQTEESATAQKKEWEQFLRINFEVSATGIQPFLKTYKEFKNLWISDE